MGNIGTKEFPQTLLTQTYTDIYGTKEKHDSPEKSRIDMVQGIYSLAKQGISPPLMLDIGSGKQSLERQLIAAHGNNPLIRDLKIVTLNIAEISASGLLAQEKNRVEHVRGNALELPFENNTFGLVVSNLAIDFLHYTTALDEVSRVLVSKGKALFNFHHPSLTAVPSKIPQVEDFWQYLRDNNVLFENEQQIKGELLVRGLHVTKIKLSTDGKDTWWEVFAEKKSQDISVP